MPRQYVRHPVDLKVRCSTRDAVLVSRATNLSRGGMFVTGETFPASEALDLTFALTQGRDDLHARARVVWSREAREGPSGMGIKFLEMSPEDGAKLAAYLRARRR